MNEATIERTKSCEMHFYDCAHKSSKSRKEFITMVHGIYTAETPGAYEARRRALFDWAAEKSTRSHVKAWFSNFWHVRRWCFTSDVNYSSLNYSMKYIIIKLPRTSESISTTLAKRSRYVHHHMETIGFNEHDKR